MTTIQNLQLSGQHMHRMFIILCLITRHCIFRQQSRKTSLPCIWAYQSSANLSDRQVGSV